VRLVVVFAAACAAAYAQPLWFEPNQGQIAGRTEWIARSGGTQIYLAPNEAALALLPEMPNARTNTPNGTTLRTHNVHMRLVGGSSRSAEGIEPLGSYSNHYAGRSKQNWFTGIPHYAKVRYKNVYPGIDMVYYGNQRKVEYDFIVNPGADPNKIELAFDNVDRLQLDSRGDLVLTAAGRELRQRKPRVFQKGHELTSSYRIHNGNHAQFALLSYDSSEPLTIDPVLEFSTFLGGPGDDNLDGIAIDSGGFVYLCGYTSTPAEPVLDPFQQTSIVVYTPIIFKFTADGQNLVYYTTINSNSWGWVNAIAVDPTGRLVVTGGTWATNFPLKNPIQTEFNSAYETGFVSRFSSDGKAMDFSTYLGGSVDDRLSALVVDGAGNIYIGGQTRSPDYPTRNPFQATYGGGYYDCVVSKIATAGTLQFSTFLGGSGWENCSGLALTPDNSILVAGGTNSDDFPLKNTLQTSRNANSQAPFVTKFTSDGQVIFSTLFGGPTSAFVNAATVDSAGSIYLAGSAGPGFTTKNAFQPNAVPFASDAFIAKFDSTMNNLIFATYLGGSAYDQVFGIAVDTNGDVIVGGYVSSPDFPLKNSLQPFRGGGLCNCDIFVAKLAAAGQPLIYSTPIGGSHSDYGGYLALNTNGDAYVVGSSQSGQDFPTKNPYQKGYGGGYDGVFFKISDNTQVAVSPLAPAPGHLLFKYVQGASAPAPQTAVISSTPAMQPFVATASDPWLVVSSSAQSTPATLTISVNTTSLAPGPYNGNIRLTPQSGSVATIDVTLSVLSPPPVLTSVDPAEVPIGSGTTAITIHGSGFTTGSIVQVDGVRFTAVSYIDQNTLSITLPQNYFTVQYNHTIAVQNPTSDLSNVLSLAVGTPPPMFTAASVTNAASFAIGPVAPGEIITVFGTNLSGSVTFDNIPATLVYTSPTQVSATVPYTVTGPTTNIQIGSSASVNVPVAPSAPGIFAAVSAGNGIVVLYATGCGALTTDALPLCALPVSVAVNNQPATLLYAGIAPGLVQGANQINIQLPEDITSGQLTIVLTAGDASSAPFSFTLP
jgi:uncharacterized protein (TIGR03437 family)